MSVEKVEVPEVSAPTDLFDGYIKLLAEDDGRRSGGVECDRIAHEGAKILLEKYRSLDFERTTREASSGPNNSSKITVAVPKNRQEYGALLREVHERLKDAWVPVGLYVVLGREFGRNGMLIDDDPSLVKAITVAGEMAKQDPNNFRMYSFTPSKDAAPLQHV